MIEKYRMLDFEAEMLADFLGEILKWEPKDRPSAQEMLAHPWLKMMPRYETKKSRKECREYRKIHGYEVSPSKKSSSSSSSSEESSDEEESKGQAEETKGSPKGSIKREEDEDGWESISAGEDK